jgi:AAA domain
MTILKPGDILFSGKPKAASSQNNRPDLKVIEGEPAPEVHDSHGEGVIWLSDWLNRSLPKAEFLCGEWLTTTTRGLVIGPTGLGKTMFGLALGVSIAGNRAFLHWKASGRPRRVLYIDGEMSRRLMKQRLCDVVNHGGGTKPAGLAVLSREDFTDMLPLNTPEGQQWMDGFIARNGPFDLIFFDNIQALLTGKMTDEDQWSEILPWVRSLTREGIAQLWFHHTGHDESHGYGSKAREWQMDTVALMENVQDAKADLCFSLKFTKARERTPDNRENFEQITIKLVEGEWLHEIGKAVTNRRLSRKQRLAHQALTSIITSEGKPVPAAFQLPLGLQCVPVQRFKDELLSRGIVDKGGKNPRARFAEVIDALKDRFVAAEKDGLIWLVQ